MKWAGQAVPEDGDQIIAQDWTSVQVGELVDVVEPAGYTYSAYIETKTERSDIVWIKACGIGTRHLLHELDGTQLHRREKP